MTQVSRTLACFLKHFTGLLRHHTPWFDSFLFNQSLSVVCWILLYLQYWRTPGSIRKFFSPKNLWNHPLILSFTPTFKLPENSVNSNYKISRIHLISSPIHSPIWAISFGPMALNTIYMLSTPKLGVPVHLHRRL